MRAVPDEPPAAGAGCRVPFAFPRPWPCAAEARCWLKMRALWMLAALLFISACDPGAIKRVRLHVPALAGSKEPLHDASVRDAIRIVDSVVAGYGVHPDTNQLINEGQVIRQYAAGSLYRPPPGGSSLDCRVELERQDLEVWFVEFPKWRSSTSVIKMRNEIRAEFVKQFGTENVH